MDPITLLGFGVGAAAVAWAWYRDKAEPNVPSVPALPVPVPSSPIPAVTMDADYLDEDEGDLDLEEEDQDAIAEFIPTTIPGSSLGVSSPTAPAGQEYNHAIWPDYSAIRKVLFALGYDIAHQYNTPPPMTAVIQFQEDYNEASEGAFLGATRQLAVDGMAGKNTLNGLERVVFGYDGPNPQDYLRWAQWKSEFDLWG